MNKLRLILFTAALALLLAAPAHAARHGGSVLVTFRPTTAIGVAVPKLQYDLDQTSVLLVIEDGRPEDQQGVLGTRTNDADDLFEIRISNDLRMVAESGLTKRAVLWGLRLAPIRGDLTLTVSITKARVNETNQAVGATYKGKVVLAGRLEDAEGVLLWEGEAKGDTSRYGRPASDENASEVMSDSLVEAFARLLSIPGLQAAWVGEELPAPEPMVEAAAPAQPSAPGKSPEALLEEILELKTGGFSQETITQFLATQRLSRVLNAGDLVEWKASGISEATMQQVMALPVQ